MASYRHFGPRYWVADLGRDVNAGDWIALVSAAAALGGGVVAFGQARIATAAAHAADRQAIAAEEQVSVMRKQLELDLADRNEAGGPTFGFGDVIADEKGERFVKAALILQRGPVLSEVRIRLGGSNARSLVGYVGDLPDKYVREDTWRGVAPIASRQIVAWMEWDAPSPLQLTLDLECVERDGQHRTWHRTYTGIARDAPPEPRGWA
jgi:hypothetical protein